MEQLVLEGLALMSSMWYYEYNNDNGDDDDGDDGDDGDDDDDDDGDVAYGHNIAASVKNGEKVKMPK